MSPTTGERSWSWILDLLRLKPARFPIGHSIRAGLTVGAPFVVGAATGQILTGMWIGLATLLTAAGEREGSHRLNVKILLISTPLAASAYLLGFLQDWPLWALIPVMMVLGWLAGVIAGYGAALSVGGMQFLVVAAIALGVDSYHTWWRPILWYVVGAAGYLALMLLEFAVDRRRPERVVLMSLTDALAGLVDARLAEVDQPSATTATSTRAARARAVGALGKARDVHTSGRAASAGHDPHWQTFADALEAADSLIAMVVTSEDRSALTAARANLAALAGGQEQQGYASSLPASRSRSFAVSVGNLRVGLGRPGEALPRTTARTDRPTRSWRERMTVGPEVRAAATRLALCCGIAYGARAYLPIEHWFWVPLTVALVMKPDFGSVFGRAVLRVVGTVIGAVIATVVLMVVPTGVGIGIVIGVLAFSVPWLMMRSYALQAVAIAPAVILLVYSLDPQLTTTLPEQRILATIVGGVVVVVFGYLIWPSARTVDVARSLRISVGALADFLAQAGTPIPADPGQRAERHEALVAARRLSYGSLSNLHTQLQRGLSEPPPALDQARAWIPAVAAVEHLTDAVSAYSVRRLDGLPVADATGLVTEVRALATTTSPDVLTEQTLAIREQLSQPVPA